MDDVLVDGDRVAGRFTYQATFQGSFMGIPPTGRRVVMHSMDIWRLVDGMAVEHWDLLDTDKFFAQLNGDDAPRSMTTTSADRPGSHPRPGSGVSASVLQRAHTILTAAADLARTEGMGCGHDAPAG